MNKLVLLCLAGLGFMINPEEKMIQSVIINYDTSYIPVNYDTVDMTGYYIESIQRLQKESEELKQRIIDIENYLELYEWYNPDYDLNIKSYQKRGRKGGDKHRN